MNFDLDSQDVVSIPAPVTPPIPTRTASLRNARHRKRLTATALIVGSGAAAPTT